MSEPAVQAEPIAAPRRRWPRRVLLGAVLGVAAFAGCCIYLHYSGQRNLRAAVAEADRIDPGWRFDDLEAARAPVPDAENGAVLVRGAHAGMPANWMVFPVGGSGLVDHLRELPPQQRPDEADLKELRAEMAKVAAALDTARGLADRPHGRYTVAWSQDLIGTMMSHVQEAREVAHMLTLDALLRALDGDMVGAVQSCRAALNTGRSLGDEPTPISQIVRITWARQAVRALERVLAQGEAPAKSLEEMQRLLEMEAEEPLQLTAARAERVTLYQGLECMRTGTGGMNRANFGMRSSFLGPTADTLIDRRQAAACQADYLHYFNELVEIAKLPTEQQQERLKALHEPAEQLPKLLDALTRGGDLQQYSRAFHKGRAELRCAAAALAAERYRMAKGDWPKSLDALVPDYLAAVPADPFDGRPLRLKRLPDGLVIYSVGPDGQDHGGRIHREWPDKEGTDFGFQLWDAARRGKPAEKK